MVFEFDQERSESNKEKHGIDFSEAHVLWDDSDVVEIRAHTVALVSGDHIPRRSSEDHIGTQVEGNGDRDL